jgi:hypothetical protein
VADFMHDKVAQDLRSFWVYVPDAVLNGLVKDCDVGTLGTRQPSLIQRDLGSHRTIQQIELNEFWTESLAAWTEAVVFKALYPGQMNAKTSESIGSFSLSSS